jgi:hypothetical protein
MSHCFYQSVWSKHPNTRRKPICDVQLTWSRIHIDDKEDGHASVELE